MKAKAVLWILRMLFLIAFTSQLSLAVCEDNLIFTYANENEYKLINHSFNYKLVYFKESDPADPFMDYFDATIILPQGIVNLSNMTKNLEKLPDSIVLWTLNGTAAGNYVLRMNVTDDLGISCILNSSVKIIDRYNPNLTIIITNISDIIISNTSYNFTVRINNTGIGSANITNFTFGDETNFSINGGREIYLSNNSNGELNLSLIAAQEGMTIALTPSSFVISLNNSLVGGDELIEIEPFLVHVNSKPVFTDNLANFTMITNSIHYLNLSEIYSDADSYDTLDNITLNISSYNSTNFTINIDRSLNQTIFTSLNNWSGSLWITLFVYDSQSESNNKSILITVLQQNETCNGLDDNYDGLIDNDPESSSNYSLYETCNNCGGIVITYGVKYCDEISHLYGDCLGYECSIVGENSNNNEDSSGGENMIFNNSLNAIITSPTQYAVSYSIGQPIHFVGSSYGGINPKSYVWDFDDGKEGNSSIISHSYNQSRSYHITLSVTDRNGDFASDFIDLSISDSCQSICATDETCCLGVCKRTECTAFEGCNFDIEECKGTDPCNNRCVLCDIECSSVDSCPNGNPYQEKECINAGKCSSECILKNQELDITILKPADEKYYDNILALDWKTNYPIDIEESLCYYQLNGDREELSENFAYIEARNGSNNLKVTCKDLEKGTWTEAFVNFVVEQDETPENSAGQSFLKPEIEGYELQNVTRETIESIINQMLGQGKISLKKSMSYVEDKTGITIGARNDYIVTMRNVILHEHIPKEAAQNTSQILSEYPFIVIEDDPVIAFIIPELLPAETIEIRYSIDGYVNKSIFSNFFTQLNNSEIDKEEYSLLLEQQEITSNVTDILKRVEVGDGKTKVLNTIKPKNTLKNVDVYLSIPKCMAQKLNELYFNNKDFKIISDDPMVVWHFDEIKDDVNLNFEVFKDITDKDCQDQAVIFTVAKEIEGRIMKNGLSSSIYSLILPLLLIPLFAYIFIYVRNISKQKEKELDDQLFNPSIDVSQKKLVLVIRKKKREGCNEPQIRARLMKAGWSIKAIDSAMAIEKIDRLKAYVKEQKTKGKNEREIIEELNQNGWSTEMINMIIADNDGEA